MAEHYTNLKDYENGIKYYMEALFHNQTDTEVNVNLVLRFSDRYSLHVS